MIKFRSFTFVRSHKAIIAALTTCTFFIIFIVRVMWLKYERHKLIFSVFNDDNETYNDIDFDSITKIQADILSLVKLRTEIIRLHEEQLIYNQHLFGPITHNSIIIVILVHKQVSHLMQLLVSLQKVSGIHETLLIFSHDFLNEAIESEIRNIEFARYMQIYYTFSTQMNPKRFPGATNTFCTQGYRCKNNDSTRDEPAAQLKHHWWWTLNHVFDHLQVTENYNNFFIFLEEDQYVTADFIYIFNKLKGILSSDCPQSEMISLGATHPKASQFHASDGRVLVKAFGSTDYNMGYAFNRTLWNVIKALRHHICFFNDYNWDHSLQHLARQRPSGEILMLSIEAPRILYTGACYYAWGEKNSALSCDIDDKMNEVEEVLQVVLPGLYPRTLSVSYNEYDVSKALQVKHSSGWDDVRDKDLCMFMSNEQMMTFKFW